MAKQFSAGQAVEFQSDTLAYFRENHGWERGTYVKKPDQWRGWHWVRGMNGEELLVPSRRLRVAKEG